MRNSHKILVGKTQLKILHGQLSLRSEYNIKTYLKARENEIGYRLDLPASVPGPVNNKRFVSIKVREFLDYLNDNYPPSTTLFHKSVSHYKAYTNNMLRASKSPASVGCKQLHPNGYKHGERREGGGEKERCI
jgi:hypothetical protein